MKNRTTVKHPRFNMVTIVSRGNCVSHSVNSSRVAFKCEDCDTVVSANSMANHTH